MSFYKNIISRIRFESKGRKLISDRQVEEFCLAIGRQMYLTNSEIISLNLTVPTVSKDLNIWKGLETEIKKRSDTILCLVEVTKEVTEIKWMKSFFDSFTKYDFFSPNRYIMFCSGLRFKGGIPKNLCPLSVKILK